MRIIFMGTPDFAVPALAALAQAGHELVAVYTQPPRPGGRRGRELTPSPVARKAGELGVPVFCPTSLKDPQAAGAMPAADVAVVAAYGLILPMPVLTVPGLGCLNIHASLLPRWRGAAPVQRAILAGDTASGVCIMRMEAGLDTGPVLARAQTPIAPADTAGTLTQRLADMGAELIVQVLADLPAFPEVPQASQGMSYARKIAKSEAKLDTTQGAAQALRQVRAFHPAPGAFFTFNGERIKLLEAELAEPAGAPGLILDDRLTIGCGDGAIRPLLVQRAGRGAMTVAELLRGFPIPTGARLD